MAATACGWLGSEVKPLLVARLVRHECDSLQGHMAVSGDKRMSEVVNELYIRHHMSMTFLVCDIVCVL